MSKRPETYDTMGVQGAAKEYKSDFYQKINFVEERFEMVQYVENGKKPKEILICQSATRQNRIGGMPIVNKHNEFLTAFPLSHMAERSLLQLCYGEEMYSTQIVGTCKSVYSKGNA